MKYLKNIVHIILLLVFSIPLFSQTSYWISVNDIPNITNMRTLHVTKYGTIFAGNSAVSVYRSTDDGKSWDVNLNFGAFSIASYDSNIFIGGESTLNETPFAYTSNNGNYWYGNHPIAWGTIHSILPLSSSTLLCATSDSIYKCNELGTLFKGYDTSIDSAWVYVLAKDSLGSLFAGTHNKGIFWSNDEGLTWSSVHSELSGCNVINDIAIIGSQYYFACTETSGVFRSTDLGTGWQPSNSGITTRRTYSLAISKDSTIYVATNQGVFKSTDFGFSWESFSQGLPPASTITQVEASPSGTLFAGTNNRGLYKTQQLPVYQKGWNLVSLPLTVTDNTVSSLLPGSSSNAFTYDSTYTQQTNLIKGHGYWIKFDSTTPALYTGSLINEDTINVKKGWNLIGSISAPVSIDSLISTPAEMHLSGFFQFEPGTGYSPITTITPGYAYWVKSDMDGQVIISSNF